MQDMVQETGATAKYIVFEGIDWCGKTTQIQLIRNRIVNGYNLDVIRLREPTRESPYGKKLREIFSRGERPPHNEEIYLFEEDRRWQKEWRVKHALMLDVIILQDRSYFSTAAYQSVTGDRTYHDFIHANERFAFIPNLVILLDMDVSNASKRIDFRGTADSMEKLDFQAKVRENFLAIYNDYGKDRNIVLVDADREQDEVTDDIMIILRENGVY